MNAPNAIAAALIAALLFGASTPLAKLLLGDLSPMLLAGLLYLGSGVGLWLARARRDRTAVSAPLLAGEWLWLSTAIVFGGILAPILLLSGLSRSTAADASLLLNLEAVFTALLAWLAFREHTDRRVIAGMALIVAGGAVLAWPGAAGAAGDFRGALAIAAACLCWGLDNNLTRRVCAADALFIAATKGLAAGLTNCTLALLLGARLPSAPLALAAMGVGLLGYGVSLVLFVMALRSLGSARTSAYFSTAPFLGAVVAVLALHDPVPSTFWIAALLMGVGLWLHLTEHHEHEHFHPAMSHAHPHIHDQHHRHEHDFPWDGNEPHSHPHRHTPLRHRHRHYPDLHHRHDH
ncbi:MAG TPA: EamA family transporter [Steroidobacteraceae bacterium]